MKRYIPIISLAIAVCSCCSHRIVNNPKKDGQKYIQINRILKAVSYALEDAYQKKLPGKDYDKFPNAIGDPTNLLNYLSEVDIELDNSFAAKVDGKVSLWVLKAEYSRKSTKASTFSYTFKPDTTKTPENMWTKSTAVGKSLDSLKIESKDLATSLAELGICLKEYKTGSLNLTQIKLEVDFTIEKVATGEADFTLGVFGINPSGELTWDSGNKLTLTFDLSKKMKIKKP
jgi:hypothetical protein